MTDEMIVAEVPGAKAVSDWFGYWPSFHDSEVINIHLNRAGESKVEVHAFEMTSQVDQRGYYVLAKHVIVSFVLDGILGMQLKWFNDQNVLSDLGIEKLDDGYDVVLGGCHGVEGSISTRSLRIELKSGRPEEGIYASEAKDTA